ncbi:putative membrane protein [Nocardioides sp. BE266]|uniref:DUF2079 domain-containing protein n=1 Tax=Nocardioides sp. BE266 TaxID=2817725 RepID=UPI00285D5C48|nr:DUF2079 domain-containing protein [Nocardioides sp. BE266]MDR7253408.1 putative membrane protein [Nocardioides sp. BE266]
MTRESVWPRWRLALVWLVSSTMYAALTTVVFRSFVVTAFDHAIIEQVVDRLAHFSAPVTEVEGAGVNYFGDHFSPVLAVYAPFYRLVPAPETLFAVQGAVLGLSVVVVLVAATKRLGRGTGLALAVLYALSFGLVNGVLMSARETPFAVLLLALAGAAFLDGSTRGVVLASLGLLLVKEDLGLTVAAIGFVLALDSRSRRAGVALMATGVVAFVVIVAVLIPHFADGGTSAYASTSGSMLDAAASGWGVKLFTLVVTFGVVGFACLRNRWALVAVPTFAWRFTAPKMAYWTPLWHYSAPLMPVVFLAAVPVLARARPLQRRLALGVAAATTALMLAWLAVVPAALVVDAYGSDRPDAARRALAQVPVGATVVADDYLVGHLAGDRTTYHVTTFGGCPRPDYFVAHVGTPERHIWGGRITDGAFVTTDDLLAFARTTYGDGLEVAYDEDGYVVLHRGPDDSSAGCRPVEPELP